MPVNHKIPNGDVIYQREQYAGSRITRKYWNYRDRQVFAFIKPEYKRIIDIGCGEGLTLEKVIRNFPNRMVLGVDLSAENITICREHGLPVIHSSIYGLSLENSSFDCCIFLEVIEHLDEPERAIAEIHRLLRSGGRVIILFPNDLLFMIARLLTFKFKEAFYDPGHVRQWTPKGLAKLLIDSGFKIVAQESLPFVFWPTSLHHLVVADKL